MSARLERTEYNKGRELEREQSQPPVVFATGQLTLPPLSDVSSPNVHPDRYHDLDMPVPMLQLAETFGRLPISALMRIVLDSLLRGRWLVCTPRFRASLNLRSLSVDDSVVIFSLSVHPLRKGRLPFDRGMAPTGRELAEWLDLRAPRARPPSNIGWPQAGSAIPDLDQMTSNDTLYVSLPYRGWVARGRKCRIERPPVRHQLWRRCLR
ncbi:hypothetical protein C8Q74DRAFT_1288171 [Fomes fomentarius]|nr:hypothetical protein C8Q74DRAFT_1288171 [Fomes fomentarius]